MRVVPGAPSGGGASLVLGAQDIGADIDVREILGGAVAAPLSLAVAFSALVTPLVVLVAHLFNREADRLHADGEPLRKSGHTDTTPVLLAAELIMVAGLLFMQVVFVRSLIRAASVTPAAISRRFRLIESVGFTCFLALVSRTALGATTDTAQNRQHAALQIVTFAAWQFFLLREMGNITGQQHLFWPNFWRTVGQSVITVLSVAVGFPAVFSTGPGTDVARIVVTLVLPFALDISGYFARVVIRAQHPARQNLGSISVVYLIFMQHLVVRAVVLSMATPLGAALATLTATISETLARSSMGFRDTFWSRGRSQDDPLSAASGRAAFLLLDHVAEYAATIMLGVVFAAFRIGHDRMAPSSSGLLLTVLLQLAVEVAWDAGFLLVAARLVRREGVLLEPSRRVVCAVALRARMTRLWLRDRFYVAAWSLQTLCSLLWYIVSFTSPQWRTVFCLWSERDGWWHYVRCTASEEWTSQ